MRRAFTLQLDNGKVAPAPIVPQTPQSATMDAGGAPRWRCSGCLMAWGVYGPTTEDGRPQGHGCVCCTPRFRHDKPRLKGDSRWMPDNAAAHEIDAQANLPFIREPVRPFLTTAMTIIEREVVAWPRLTHSCEGYIRDKVRAALREELEEEFQTGGMVVDVPVIEFVYKSATVAYALPAAMMEVSLGYRPANQHRNNTDLHIIRYRWVQ